jgi:D-sedoheptulose 7-phosphate isomerase
MAAHAIVPKLVPQAGSDLRPVTPHGALSYMQELSAVLASFEASDAAGSVLSLDAAMDRAVDLVDRATKAGRKVLLIGNGGSAGIVSHMQNDLCKAAKARAMVFNEAPLLTAYSNDESYEVAFERMIELWAEPGDVLVAVSSSGRSRNIIRAAAACRARGGIVLTLSGFTADNPLRSEGDVNFYAPAASYGMVEMAHAVLGHCLTDAVAELANEARRADTGEIPLRAVRS